ncbi:MAG: NAD-dependent epimerase/dehydratase family protein [Methanobacteriota archaeon]|nr:MAG: NAD-dependent epimerase/dehydratase family protein [Euryarchaeota archaeon]
MAPQAFITGGTGFIGHRLVKRLLDDGWSVRALVLEPERTRLPEHPRLELLVGDVTKAETFRGGMDGADAVFHLAALVAAWIRDNREYFRVNVQGTAHVIDEAIRARVPRFLFTSSMSGIGVTPGAVMREDSPPGKAFGPYELSKAQAERLVENAVRERGLPAITLIPSIVLGSGDTFNTGKFLLSYVKGEFPGTFAEDSRLPVVGADDVARAHLLAYHRGRVGERYIICGENVGWGEIMRIASAASGTPMPSRHIGARAIWLASRSGEVFSRVTRSAPRLPAWLADFLLTGATMDHGKSVRELGMTYRPIAESIQEAIDWFRAEGLVRGPQRAPYEVPGLQLPVENPPPEVPGEVEPRIPPAGGLPARNQRRRPPEGPT